MKKMGLTTTGMFSLLKSLSKVMIPGGGLLPFTVLPLKESNCQTFEDGEDTDPDEPVDSRVENKGKLKVVQG